MTRLTHRSEEQELLDLGPEHYSSQEYAHCLKMLFRVNKLFGFLRDTRKLLLQFPKNSVVTDVGCGGGLFLLHLSQHFPQMRFVGTDIAAEAIDVANCELQKWQSKNPHVNVIFQLQNQPKLVLADNSVDILLATMVCHHIPDAALIEFFQRAMSVTNKAVIINDLHRHRLAQWFYKIISPLLFRNRLITHDGLISIRRGFTRKEWQLLLQKAGILDYEIKWRFPFRWRVILWKK